MLPPLLLLQLQVKPPARASVCTQTSCSGEEQSICFPRPAWGRRNHRVVSSDDTAMEECVIIAATSSGSSAAAAAADELVTEEVQGEQGVLAVAAVEAEEAQEAEEMRSVPVKGSKEEGRTGCHNAQDNRDISHKDQGGTDDRKHRVPAHDGEWAEG